MRAALVTPLSGPLARFGVDGADALALWARGVAVRGVDLEVHDAHPSAAAAMRAAVASAPDVVFGPYGSGPCLAAARATTRLVWNHGGATSQLGWASTPNTINVLAPASTYLHGALAVVRAAGVEHAEVAVLHADTGFGRDVAVGAAGCATQLGWPVARHPFAPDDGARAAADLPGTDILLVAGGFDDELAAAPVVLDRVRLAAAMVSAGEQDVLAPLGARRDGLLGPAQWVLQAAPEATVGPDATWFAAAYTGATGRPPSYPAAQAFAAGVVAEHCLRAAGGGADDASLRAAALTAHVTTLFGAFRLDPTTGLQVGHEVVTVQWQAGRRRVVWPPDRADAPLVLRRHGG